MTYSEYKALVKEYGETDSIKRRDEIKELIREESISLCEILEGLYNIYGSQFVCDGEYQIGKGGYSLEEFNTTTAYIAYSDHWQYGGECIIGIEVPMKYLDEDERLKLQEELKRKHIDSLKKTYKMNLDHIESIKKKNEEILDSLIKLGSIIE